MTYDEIANVFLTPLERAIPEPRVTTTPARRLRDALEPLATQGWWSRPAGERISALGLPFFPGYVWGRAAALGTPTAAVVVATFGVFEPNLLTGVYEAGASLASRGDVLTARADGAAESLGAVTDTGEADALASALMRAVDGLDGMGRPLFSGLRALPAPATAAGRLWRAAELVREHRGDGHLAALATAGLDAVEANVLTEVWLGFNPGEYTGSRGFGPEQVVSAVDRLEQRGWMLDGHLSDAGRAAREAIEDTTDRTQDALVAALGTDMPDVTSRVAVIADRLLAARAFPPDPRKRAAG